MIWTKMFGGATFGFQILEVVNWIAMIISDVLLSFSLASRWLGICRWMKVFLQQCFDFPSFQFVYLPLTWSGVPEQYFDSPPLRSQGDLVTQPSQSKLDATIRCHFVAAFFNCPSITRPATEFYRDLKEKDAVISSVPKMRKKMGTFQLQESTGTICIAWPGVRTKRFMCAQWLQKLKPPWGKKYGQSGWWNLRVEDILIRASLATLAR